MVMLGDETDVLTPIAINLERVDSSEEWVRDNPVLCYPVTDLCGHGTHLLGQMPRACMFYLFHDLRRSLEGPREHHVGRDEELKNSGIVRWAKCRAYETCVGFDRIS